MPLEATHPKSIIAAFADLDVALYHTVPFKRVGAINAAIEHILTTISNELATMRDDSFLAAARLCESRSRTLKSKPASFEALNCGNAIIKSGKYELARLREEKRAKPSQPSDAGVTDTNSVGAESGHMKEIL